MWEAVAKLAPFGVLAGCGLATSGLLATSVGGGPGGPDAATTTPAPDATSPVIIPGDDASPSDDAGTSPVDADPADDASAATDASEASSDACPSPSTDAAVAVATSVAPPPKIDGDLSDWGCGPWTELDATNGAYFQPGGQTLSGQFAVRWDAANLYVAVHVALPTVRGNDATNPYDNDAVEIYLSGDAPRTGDYDALSHQYIVNWKNLAVDYGPIHYPPSKPVTSPPDFVSQAKTVADGWQVEIAIGWKAVGSGKGPTAGATVGFDLQLDDGDGTALDSRVIETLAPHSKTCGCKSCCCAQTTSDFPNCDTLTFGTLTLQ